MQPRPQNNFLKKIKSKNSFCFPLIAKRCVGDEVDINEHVSGPFDHSEVKVLVVNSTLLIPKSFIID